MRFYKPRLREYVSTQVDMPWEFLQGVAEQKQKGYDTALATGDAASKLLNFEVNPGDMPGKQAIQQEYNELLYGITDYIRQTGDFNSASREFSKIIRDISQDKRIQTMTAAVDPYKKERPVVEEMKLKGELRNPWDTDWDPNFSTYNPRTGELKPYNQKLGIKTPDFQKDRADNFGQLKLSEDGKGYDIIDNVQYLADGTPNPNFGSKISITTSRGVIDPLMIKQRAENALFTYQKSGSYQNHIRKYDWLFKNNQITDPKLIEEYNADPYGTITKLANDESINELYIHGLDQVQSKSNQEVRQGFMSQDWINTRRPIEENLTPGPDSSLVTQEYKPIDISDLTYIGSVDVDLTKEGIRGLRSAPVQKIPTTFQQVPSKYRETFEKMYKLYKGETAYNNIKEGKSTLTKDELNQFTLLYNSLHQGLRTNTSTAPIGTKPAEISAKHGDLFGVPEEAVKADVLTKGPAGYSPNTKIYDAVEGEWTTFDKINRTDDKDKQLTYRVNKRFTTQNPLYLLSGNDKRYVKGYSLISSDGKYQFIIPEKENKISEIDELQAQLGSAIYSEGTPVKIDKLSTNGNNVFSLYKDGLFTLMTIDPQTGVPEYYTDKEGKTIATQSATDMQKWITQNTPKK
jgi:hypothetical protein